MSLRTCIVDTRNPPALTKRDRQRKCNLGLVSPLWKGSTQPLVLAERNGPHAAPGWLEAGGQVEPDTIYSDVSLLSEAHPFPDDKPFVLWSLGDQKLYGLNLASPGCGEMYAEMLVARTESWAKAVCLDFFATWAWLIEERLIALVGGDVNWNARTPAEKTAAWRYYFPWATTAWFAAFDAGLRMTAERLRQLKPDWWIGGYDWNYHGSSSALDMIFVEDRYSRLQPLSTTKALAERIGTERGIPSAKVIMEIRAPQTFDPNRIAEIEATADVNGWFVSKGRDATAIGSAA